MVGWDEEHLNAPLSRVMHCNAKALLAATCIGVQCLPAAITAVLVQKGKGSTKYGTKHGSKKRKGGGRGRGRGGSKWQSECCGLWPGCVHWAPTCSLSLFCQPPAGCAWLAWQLWQFG